MKIISRLFVIAVVTAFFSGSAGAEPKNGLGLSAGLASHNRDCGACTGPSTAGLSIGLDYQFALSSQFSFNPFLMSSSETVKNVSGTKAGHGILGAQLRYWAGDMFIGGHVGSYSEVFITSGTTVSTASGLGAGLVVGWEQPDGGVFIMGQLDSATVTPSSPLYSDVNFSAFRLSAGYRWK